MLGHPTVEMPAESRPDEAGGTRDCYGLKPNTMVWQIFNSGWLSHLEGTNRAWEAQMRGVFDRSQSPRMQRTRGSILP